MDKELAGQVAEIAQRVVASGAISANGHGNVSVRVPGAEEMYFTAGPSLRNHPASMVVRVGLDGTLLEGDLPPIQGAVVAMHTAMYADHPDVGCVLHTHSPYATAYAVARRPIGCWVEALAMFGAPSGVPVAGYGPRGSDEAIANIRAAVTPGVPAVLLANHGVLVFHRTPELAILIGSVVEEAAQAGINAAGLGGPAEIPEGMRAAAKRHPGRQQNPAARRVIVDIGVGRKLAQLQHRQRLLGIDAFVAIEGERRVVEHIQAVRDQADQQQAHDDRPLARFGARPIARDGLRDQAAGKRACVNHSSLLP